MTNVQPGRTSRGADRKEEILRAAERVFADKGFSAATVRDIATQAGLLSGSLYWVSA